MIALGVWSERAPRMLRGLGMVLALSFRVEPRLALAGLVMLPASQAITALLPLWLKLLADGVLAGDARRTAISVALIALAVGTDWLLNGLGIQVRMTMTERVGLAVNERLALTTARLPGLEHHERADYQNRLQILRQNQASLGQIWNAVINLLMNSVRVAVIVVLLSRLSPWLLLLCVLAVPVVLTEVRVQRRWRLADERCAELERRRNHLRRLATDAGPAKEVRVFGLAGEVRRRHAELAASVYRERVGAQRFASLAKLPSTAMLAAGLAASVLLLVVRATRGEASAGDVLMGLALVTQVVGNVTGLLFNTSWALQLLRTVDHLVWLLDYEADAVRPAAQVAAPERIRDGLQLRSVCFRYKDGGRLALSDVDLRLPAGTVVAIVGENGAGKTTLAKLLCRYYEPAAGAIEVDGVDIRRFDPAAWRRCIGGAFQDFVKFELLARETVGVGDLPSLDSRERVSAAVQEAAADDVIASLPRGLDSQLGRTWQDGVDLSGGQWQKLALARTLMRDAPLLTIYDEPTASLDALAEHELFASLARSAGARKENGTVTILISHRFSTVRMADLIVVLKAGRVAELGDHDQLMALGGLYAELYSLQRSALVPDRTGG